MGRGGRGHGGSIDWAGLPARRVVARTRDVRGDTRQGAWREWDGPKRSWAEARRRALGRLLAEAAQLGAHAVLGVQARREEAAGATGPVIEVVLTGTAVRLDVRCRAD